MQNYEFTFISTEEKGAEAISKILKDAGVEILSEQDLGQKKLAYPIKKQLSGFYFCLNVKADRTAIAALEKKINLQKTILRLLIVRLNESAQETAAPVKKAAKETEKPVSETEKAEAIEEEVEKPVETIEPVAVIKKTEKPAKTEEPKVEKKKPTKSDKQAEQDKANEEQERLKKLEEKLDQLLRD